MNAFYQRGRWEGVTNIVRFNWHFYAVALLGLCGAVVLLGLWEIPVVLKRGIGVGAGIASFYLIVSLAVSHFIYDRSDLYRFQWLDKIPLPATGTFVNIHSGFDETSLLLKQRLPARQWILLDFYDPHVHTEISIARARWYKPVLPETIAVQANHWGLESSSVAAIFGLLAVHEIRNLDEKTAFFQEAYRVLQPSGTFVLVEHLRNPANFLAYGPGFLHFFSEITWTKAFAKAGFQPMSQFFITPFIKVFVLSKRQAIT